MQELETNWREGTLFFNQPIPDDVLAYVRPRQTYQADLREGNVVRITKIPYQAHQCLQETDQMLKRYLYCHCGWARDSTLNGPPVSAVFCQCSAGLKKQPWEAALDAPLRAEVESRCYRGTCSAGLPFIFPRSSRHNHKKKLFFVLASLVNTRSLFEMNELDSR